MQKKLNEEIAMICPKCKRATNVCFINNTTLISWCPYCVKEYRYNICQNCMDIFEESEYKLCPKCREETIAILEKIIV